MQSEGRTCVTPRAGEQSAATLPQPSPGGLSGGFRRLPPLAELESAWRALEAVSDCSFFQSWGWIGAWLRLIEGRTNLYLYECHQGPTLVAMAVVSKQIVVRRGILRVTTLSLHKTPGIGPDLFIEYNGCLARSGYEADAMMQLFRDSSTLSDDWDEVQLANIPSQVWNGLDTSGTNLNLCVDELLSTWIAPLQDALEVDNILSQLRASRRSKVARSFREYARLGELTLSTASTAEEAVRDFLAMGDLHTRRWNLAGLPGSFADDEWVKFHKDVIRSGMPRGDVQLVHVRCGTRTIGYIYNFLWRGSVLMLQSGFAQEASNHLRPGYVSHILTMRHNARLGYHTYDFLAGDSDYKTVLSNPGEPLVTGRLQRPRWRLRAEELAVTSFRRLKALRRKALFRRTVRSDK